MKISSRFALLTLVVFLLGSTWAQAQELVTVKLITPQEGMAIPASRVSMEAKNGQPEQLFEADPDGVTYHLPAGEEIWFEVFPNEEEGYFVSQWKMDGSPIAYSSYLDNMALKVYEGLTLEIELAREGVMYTVEYDAPYGTMIRCINRSAATDTPVASGEKVAAASNILFMISPENNPDGKVPLEHWLINGRICVDGANEPITNNSIEFKLLEDVSVTATLLAPRGVETLDRCAFGYELTPEGLRIYNVEGAVVLYDGVGKQLSAHIAQGGETTFRTAGYAPGGYIVRNHNASLKVVLP